MRKRNPRVMILGFAGLGFMRVFAIFATLCAVSFLNLAQTAKPKSTSQTAKPKVAATPSKKPVAAKPKPKPAATPAKKSTAANPKPVATPTKKPDEKTVWTKAVNTNGRDARIAALQKFNETFPKSSRRTEAQTMLAFLRIEAGNEKLSANDVDGAAADFKAAATDAPKPVPEQLWTEALAKIAANLYFRGAPASAVEIERTLESKAEANAKQLLDIANFYMMIENGGEAKRMSLKAIELEPNSSAAYQSLGLANRIEFQLNGSASAYERALELDPTSVDSKRGLAEMKRALGKSDEAATLYREILTTDANSLLAQTGLILALFDAGLRAEAETELSKSLEANPGNVILLAGAAYWYAAHNEGARAVELAQKAVEIDPRFIWSHVALARGFLLQNRAADAEKTLLAARRYGNFPTVEYELAAARLAAGYYRDAAEGLLSAFKIKEGAIVTNLGGRVAREARNFTELIADERRASIFAPLAADTSENAERLAALLEFKQQLDAADKKDESLTAAVDQFVNGGDRMKVYRQIFAASQLLEKKAALPKVLELTKAATSGVEAGLDLPNSSVAVMASELYESRAIATTKGEYVVVSNVPRYTLSAVLRGHIEELAGWANYNLGSPDEAIIRLRRAVGVLPADSAWWRSSTWRLGAAYSLAGRDAEALDMYIKSYKSTGPDLIRYGVIEALYRRVNGNTNGLDDKIGPNPAPQVSPDIVAQKPEPITVPPGEPAPTPETKPEPTPDAARPIPSVVPVATPTPEEIRPAATPLPQVSPDIVAQKPESITVPPGEPAPTPETKPEPTPDAARPIPSVVPVATPTPEEISPVATPTPEEIRPAATPLPEVSPSPGSPGPTPSPTPEETKPATPLEVMPTPERTDPSPTPSPSPSPEAALEPQNSETPRPTPDAKIEARTKELFPPVIITIPAPSVGKPEVTETKPEPSPSPTATVEPTPTPTPTPSPAPTGSQPVAEDVRPRIVETKPDTPPEVVPCRLTVSEETINLKNSSGKLAVIVGLDDDGDVDAVQAASSSPKDVTVRREPIAGLTTRALFVLQSMSDRIGLYQVTFDLPCGKRTITVNVR